MEGRYARKRALLKALCFRMPFSFGVATALMESSRDSNDSPSVKTLSPMEPISVPAVMKLERFDR
jgi:hypothetical protein